MFGLCVFQLSEQEPELAILVGGFEAFLLEAAEFGVVGDVECHGLFELQHLVGELRVGVWREAEGVAGPEAAGQDVGVLAPGLAVGGRVLVPLDGIDALLEPANQLLLPRLLLLMGQVALAGRQHGVEAPLLQRLVLGLQLSHRVVEHLVRHLAPDGLLPIRRGHWVVHLGLHAVKVNVHELTLVLIFEVLHALLDVFKILLCLVQGAQLRMERRLSGPASRGDHRRVLLLQGSPNLFIVGQRQYFLHFFFERVKGLYKREN